MTQSPGYGQVWIDGYWNWNGYEWVWVGGRWETEQSGYVYVQPYYDYSGSSYNYRPGYWSTPDRAPWLLAVVAIVVILIMKLVLKWPFESGIPSVMILILFMGGLQMMSMGVLGAYVGRIYDEAKRRPKFIVEESVGLTGEFRRRLLPMLRW